MKMLWCQVVHRDIPSENMSYEGVSWHENISMTVSPRKQVLFSVQELLMKVEQPPVIVRLCYASLSKSMFQNDCNLKSHSKGRHHKAVFILWLLNCTKSVGKKFFYITVQESCHRKNYALLTILYSLFTRSNRAQFVQHTLQLSIKGVSWCFT